MFTWYSVMRPLSQRTCCSLIHAPRMLRSVFVARLRASWIASSELFQEVALISDTLATDILPPSTPVALLEDALLGAGRAHGRRTHPRSVENRPPRECGEQHNAVLCDRYFLRCS